MPGFCACCKTQAEKGRKIRNPTEVRIFIEILPTTEDQWVCSKCFVREIKKLSASKKSHHKQREEEQNSRFSSLEKKVSIIEATSNQTKTQVENIVNSGEEAEREKQDKLQANQSRLADERRRNIYSFATPYHWIGWSIFFILIPILFYYIKKYTNKLKRKKSENLKEEIQDKFNLWRLNMGLSMGAYAVSFVLLKNAIDKWLRPNIDEWLGKNENTTVAIVTGILGLLFLADGIITSELKTPLQRLSIKIENANINERKKKDLLSKTQQSNETFKETLKRFGLLSIAGITIKLLGKAFDDNVFSLLCYVVPIVFGTWRILQSERTIRRWKIKENNNMVQEI